MTLREILASAGGIPFLFFSFLFFSFHFFLWSRNNQAVLIWKKKKKKKKNDQINRQKKNPLLLEYVLPDFSREMKGYARVISLLVSISIKDTLKNESSVVGAFGGLFQKRPNRAGCFDEKREIHCPRAFILSFYHRYPNTFAFLTQYLS